MRSAEAKRSPEWRDGIARVLKASPPAVIASLLEPYLRAVGPHDASGMPASYPGSPAIAQALLRPKDRIALCEAHPEEKEKLVAALGRDPRLSIVDTDGYVALNAYLPPKERRGLVLIDPAFEEPNEASHVEEALARAIRKWPTGAYVAWRPIRDAIADVRFLNGIAALGAPDILRIELDVGPGEAGVHGQEPLARAGLLVVNPPHTLIVEARALMPWLAAVLALSLTLIAGTAGSGRHVCEWLTKPR